ncbi:MAG: tetratricopeptide repeat protein [Fimbriimonadaceae bacterium]
MSERIAAMMQAGEWEDAIHACQAVLQVQPTCGKFHAALGESYFQVGRLNEAATSFERAYVLDPTLWRSAVRHAQVLEKLHRYRESMDVVTEWLRTKPGNTDLLGLKEFLETQPESQEHDGWERTRRLGVTVISAGFQREEEVSVANQIEAAEAEAHSAAPGQKWAPQVQLQQNPSSG